MKKNYENGWHNISGFDCYIEDELIKRAITTDSNNSQITAYPYKFDKKLNCWNKCTPKIDTFKTGIKKGNYTIM